MNIREYLDQPRSPHDRKKLIEVPEVKDFYDWVFSQCNTVKEVERLHSMLLRVSGDCSYPHKKAISDACDHDYGKWSYTIRRNVLGEYKYWYEKTCSHCGHTHYERMDNKMTGLDYEPNEKYYNNHI